MQLLPIHIISLAAACILASSCAAGHRADARGTNQDARATTEQGIQDARRDLAEGRYRIMRYDQSIVRTGNWQRYRANFERFGIEELPGMGTKDYGDAYNRVMDRALLKEFNGPYRKLRREILPPPDAVPYFRWRTL